LTRAVNTLQQDTSRTLLAVQKVSDHLDGDLTQLTPMLRDTLLTAQRAIKDADVTLAHTAEFTAPGAPARSDLEEALRKLAIASEALRNFAETIERNPQALIRGGARQ
jgi:paraquat-inducible protein B